MIALLVAVLGFFFKRFLPGAPPSVAYEVLLAEQKAKGRYDAEVVTLSDAALDERLRQLRKPRT